MPLLRSLALMIATLFGPAAALAGQTGGGTILGPAPVLGGGSYSTGGGITVAVETREAQGRLAICGTWAESERLTAYLIGQSRRILASGSLAVDGRQVHHGLLFLNQVEPAESYAGAEAACVVTTLPWRADAAPEVWIPRQTVVVERGGSGNLEIRFGARDTPNPAMQAGSLLPRDWTRFPRKAGN